MKRKNEAAIAAILGALALGAPLKANSAVSADEALAGAFTPAETECGRHPRSCASATVVLFFKPGHEHSEAVLRQFAELEAEFAWRDIRWIAVISDHDSVADADRSRRQAGSEIEIAVDRDDAWFGRLGIKLHPTTVLLGPDGRPTACEPFSKINYPALIRAQVQYALKEIGDRELAAIRSPSAVADSDSRSVASRRLKLARKLLDAKLYRQAYQNAKASIEKDPTNAEAYVLLGRACAAENLKTEAADAFARALELDPTNETALRARAGLQLPAPP